MRPALAMLIALLLLASAAPAYAFICDNPCKDGEVYSDDEEVCVPRPKPIG